MTVLHVEKHRNESFAVFVPRFFHTLHDCSRDGFKKLKEVYTLITMLPFFHVCSSLDMQRESDSAIFGTDDASLRHTFVLFI